MEKGKMVICQLMDGQGGVTPKSLQEKVPEKPAPAGLAALPEPRPHHSIATLPPSTYHSSIQGSGLPHCAKRSRAEMPGGRQSDPGCLAQVQDKWTGRSQMSPLQ